MTGTWRPQRIDEKDDKGSDRSVLRWFSHIEKKTKIRPTRDDVNSAFREKGPGMETAITHARDRNE